MKVLFLSQGVTINDHPGWHDALIKLKAEGEISDFHNIPYFGYAGKYGWESFYNHVVSLCRQQKFDVVYFHYFHKKGKPSPGPCINALRNLKEAPVVITSCGDGFSDNWMTPDYPEDFKEASRLSDITFSTQMGKAASKMIKWGAKKIVYIPNSVCQVRFRARKVDLETHKFEYDIVFVGSNNGNSFFKPTSKQWWGAKHRQKLVKKLHNKFGGRLGLFGNGWQFPDAKGPVAFNQQQEAFRKGKVVVGGNPYSYSDYYSSNRVFFEISSGIPTIELLVPRLNMVLRDNDHCYFARDYDEVIDQCEKLLSSDPQMIYSKAARAAKYIEEKHTQYHRMKFKIDTVKKFMRNDRQLDVSFPFFLPEVDVESEKKYSIRTVN